MLALHANLPAPAEGTVASLPFDFSTSPDFYIFDMNSTRNKNAEAHKFGGHPFIDDPRRHFISTRLNDRELSIVESKILDCGLTKSEAVRLLLTHEVLPQKIYGGVNVLSAEAYLKLQPLQSNINQIARWLNKTRPTTISAQNLQAIYKHMKAVEVFLRQLRQYILTSGVQK